MLKLIGLPLFCVFFMLSAVTAKAEETPIAKVSAALGKSYILRDGDKLSVSKGMALFKADQLVTSNNAMVRIVFVDGTSIMAYKDSSFEIEDYRTRAQGKKVGLDSVMGLVRGQIKMFVKPRDGGHNATVKSKNAVMGVRGTEFIVSQEAAEQASPVTKLIVLKGSVAFAPLDDDGNPVLSAPAEEGGLATPQEVLVNAGETSVVVEAKAPAPPVKVPVEEVRELLAETQKIAQADSLPEADLLKDLQLPPPTPVRPGPDLIRHQSSPSLVVLPKETPEEVVPESVGGNRPNVVVLPRDAVLMTEMGLACNQKSMEGFRHAAQRFDEEAVLIGENLLPCDEFQDEVFFWLFTYHVIRGETRRATFVTKVFKEPTEALDLITPRERDLILFRKKDTARILMRAGRDKKDMQILLLAARSAVLKGAWDEALKLYSEATDGHQTPRTALVRVEAAYVQILRKDYDGARSSLESLDVRRLTEGEKISVALAFDWIRQQKLEREFAGSFLEASMQNFSDSDGWSRLEMGIGWQGEMFSLDSGIGNIAFAKHGEAIGGNPRAIRPEDFGYARLGAGARTHFSTGASASVRGDFYGSEDPRFGFGLGGEYPFLSHYVASVALSQMPQFLEFVTDANQLGFTLTTFGMGIRAFDAVFYELEIEQRTEAGNGSNHKLKGLVPVHRTPDPDKRIDVAFEGRYLTYDENSLFWYTPKSAASVLGGVESSWRFGNWLHFDLGILLGYLSRKAHAVDDLSPRSPYNEPWLARESIGSAILFEGSTALRTVWGSGWYTGLEFKGAAENAILDPNDQGPKPPSKARSPARSEAKLSVGWNYGSL